MLKIFYQGFGSAIFFEKIIFERHRKVRRLFVTQAKKTVYLSLYSQYFIINFKFDKIRIDNQAAKVFLVIIL